MNKGILITFEGGEGCGKSTQIKKFAEFLEQNKVEYILSREPGGTQLGEDIRAVLLYQKDRALSAKEEFLLFSAARARHVQQVINPALSSGKVVILDRYYDSSFAYQGAGGLKYEEMKMITDFTIEDAVPDLTFLLDISFEEGMKRKSQDEKLKNLDRIELKGKEFHDKVRNQYLSLAEKNKERIHVIDASKSIEEVHSQICEIVKKYL